MGRACTGFCEYDKHVQNTYKENYGEFSFGDITQITNTSLEKNWADLISDNDILIGGFSC